LTGGRAMDYDDALQVIKTDTLARLEFGDLSVYEEKDYDLMVAELVDEMFFPDDMRPAYQKRNKEMILEAYHDVFRDSKGRPDFTDIVQVIFDYNYNICCRLAEIEYHFKYEPKPEYQNIDDDEKDEEISGLEQEWYNDFFVNYDSATQDMVLDILSEHKMYYEIDKMDEIYSCYHQGMWRMIRIAALDCQNTIREIKEEQMKFLDDAGYDIENLTVIKEAFGLLL
jgi:hypothetical protein